MSTTTSKMSTFKVISYKSESCGLCFRMSHYDEKVSHLMGYEFEAVNVDHPGENRDLIRHLIKLFPDKTKISFPAYVIVIDDAFSEGWKGACPKHIFKNRLEIHFSKYGQRSQFSPELTEDRADPV